MISDKSLQWRVDMLHAAWVEASNDARRYGSIVEWLAENNPGALDLCPFKTDGTTVVRPSEPRAGSQAGLSGPSGSPTSHRPAGGEAVSGDAQAVEQRVADASASPVPTSPPTTSDRYSGRHPNVDSSRVAEREEMSA